MDRINYVCFNHQRYEQDLSPFGKKVLTKFIQHSNKERNRKLNRNEYEYRQLPAKYKKVLAFNAESDSVDEISYTRLIHKSIPILSPIPSEIPRSVELIETVSKGDCTHDFLHPTLATNKNLVYNIYNTDSDNDTTLDETIFNTKTKENAVVSTKINWDNILDSELFIDVANNESDNTEPNEIPLCKYKKRKIKITSNSKMKKVRNSSSGLENQQNQNSAIASSSANNNFRKEKYTKTVKNWLDNIELQHPVEEDVNNNLRISDIDHNSMDVDKPGIGDIKYKSDLNNKPTTIIEKTLIDRTVKTTKKIVQAQLANKNGVMKYSKPKNDGKESTNNSENKLNNTKEKTVKKVEAPIKSQIPVKEVRYEICTLDENNIENYLGKLREIKNVEIVAVLIFSNGFCQLNSHYTENTCIPDGIIVSNGDVFYCFKSAGEMLKEALKYILENNQIVCYGARGILVYLASYLKMGINSIYRIYDAQIGASLLDPDKPSENFTDLQKLLSFTATFTIATECTLQKSAWYMSLLKECWLKLHSMLVEDSLWKVFVDIEMKLLPIIAGMEVRGVSIDMTKLKSMEDVLVKRMKLVEQQCYKAAGRVFQINSAVQVRTILYDELQLDTKSNVKIRETICKGAKSTSETMLRSLITEHPLPKLILEYRHLHKANATFLAGIAQHVKDGIVHPTWIQTAAATGRIASNNPNLQAIPKAPYRLVMYPEPGDSEEAGREQLMFRSVYVSRAGVTLVAADFQHVECRVFAAAAADTRLLAALAPDTDLFKVLASKWLNKSEADVGVEERERTKRLVYASLYGAGTRKLMEILDVDYQQALQVAASFNSSAADLCKIAMILTEEHLRGSTPPVDAHLVLQIHDELVWEVNDQDVDRAAVLIKQVMEGCGQQCGMAVALPVVISVGKNWGQMHEYLHSSVIQ